MGSFIEETTLHFEDDTFKKLRTDADQVLQKLLANMAEKGSLEGKMTITIDVSFTEETVQNRDPNIEGDMRIVHYFFDKIWREKGHPASRRMNPTKKKRFGGRK